MSTIELAREHPRRSGSLTGMGIVFDFGVASDRGANPARPVNEDRGLIGELPCSDDPTQSITIAAVADGMGGMDRGEIAAATAMVALASATPSLADISSEDALADWLVTRVVVANGSVANAVGGGRGGTTLTAVALLYDRLVLAHVGDSRAYLWRDGHLSQLTQDHSLSAMLVQSGQMSASEARSRRNALLRALGAKEQIDRDYVDDLAAAELNTGRSLRLVAGDRVVLTSDGVWDVVAAPELEWVTSRSMTAQEMADALVQEALHCGAPDNATAVVISTS